MSDKRISLEANDGKRYEVKVPEGEPSLRSCYLFAFVKSGSTLMEKLVSDYCDAIGAPYFSLYDQAFAQGITTPNIRSDALQCFAEDGIIFSGFRHYPSFDLPISGANVILLVRDPRDMMVSLYFSILKSHVIPAGNERLRREREQLVGFSIDEFVLKRARGYLLAYRRYMDKLSEARKRVFRYEDVIYNKDEWLAEIVDFAGLPHKPKEIKRISARHDVVPAREDASNHIRQVHPGNFRKKLRRDTIEQLNVVLSEFLDDFGYPRS